MPGHSRFEHRRGIKLAAPPRHGQRRLASRRSGAQLDPRVCQQSVQRMSMAARSGTVKCCEPYRCCGVGVDEGVRKQEGDRIGASSTRHFQKRNVPT